MIKILEYSHSTCISLREISDLLRKYNIKILEEHCLLNNEWKVVLDCPLYKENAKEAEKELVKYNNVSKLYYKKYGNEPKNAYFYYTAPKDWVENPKDMNDCEYEY